MNYPVGISLTVPILYFASNFIKNETAVTKITYRLKNE